MVIQFFKEIRFANHRLVSIDSCNRYQHWYIALQHSWIDELAFSAKAKTDLYTSGTNGGDVLRLITKGKKLEQRQWKL